MPQRRRQTNPRLIEEIQSSWQNSSDKEIAERTGFSVIHVQVTRLKMGLVRENAKLIPKDMRERVRYLVEEEGWPASEVQEELGVGPQTVRRWSSPEARARNAKEYLSVIRWARNNHEALFGEIRPVEARRAGQKTGRSE